MTTPPLHIHWQLAEPPVAPTTWHHWAKHRPAGPVSGGEKVALEERLGWPPGTVAALRRAFDARLGRRCGWDAQGLSPAEEKALRWAAYVFKRGVAYRDGEGAPSPQQRQGSYPIRFADPKTFPGVEGKSREIFYVIDGNVDRQWPQLGHWSPRHVVTLTEHEKTLPSVAALVEAWRNAGEPAQWTVVGGGVLTDTAAFAAALCGCPVRFIPTTLLAMADACVGGKTGVNFPPYGKNQIGRFYFPDDVLVWPGWLSTLPQREFRAGGTECLKHAFLKGDRALADTLKDALARGEPATLSQALVQVIDLKAEVVRSDPGEGGYRAVLNLGHTLAHALEAVSQARTSGDQTLLHGEAVGVGLAFALMVSSTHGSMAKKQSEDLFGKLQDSGCLLSAEELSFRLGTSSLEDPALWAELSELMSHDKKGEASPGGDTSFVLLEAPGATDRGPEGSWTVPVPPAALERAWALLHERL